MTLRCLTGIALILRSLLPFLFDLFLSFLLLLLLLTLFFLLLFPVFWRNRFHLDDFYIFLRLFHGNDVVVGDTFQQELFQLASRGRWGVDYIAFVEGRQYLVDR